MAIIHRYDKPFVPTITAKPSPIKKVVDESIISLYQQGAKRWGVGQKRKPFDQLKSDWRNLGRFEGKRARQKSVTVSITERDIHWSRVKAAIKSFNGLTVQVGLPSGGTFTKMSGARSKSYGDMISAAVINEFGSRSKGIPERAAFRTTFEEQKRPIEQMMNQGAQMVLHGGPTPKDVLQAVGEHMVEKLVERITGYFPPPNAPSTVSNKGFDFPLVESEQLVHNIQYKVVKQNDRRNLRRYP